MEIHNLKIGDVWEAKPKAYGHSSSGRASLNMKMCQSFRNTPSHELLFEFGRTYVGLGYVDLSQLIWGRFIDGKGPLQYYGYDMAEGSVARSLLIWEMLKAPANQVRDKTILQVWFSSCWDKQTKHQFDTITGKLIEKCDNALLNKYVQIWGCQ